MGWAVLERRLIFLPPNTGFRVAQHYPLLQLSASTTPARSLRGSKAPASGTEPVQVLGTRAWAGCGRGSCMPQRESAPQGSRPRRQGEARRGDASRQEGAEGCGLGRLPPAGGLQREAGRRTQVTTATSARSSARAHLIWAGAARAGRGLRGRGGASYPAGPAPKPKEPLRETFLQGWAHAVMPPGAQSTFRDSPRARLQAETRAGPVSHGLNLTDSLCDCGRASSPQRGRRSLLGYLSAHSPGLRVRTCAFPAWSVPSGCLS